MQVCSATVTIIAIWQAVCIALCHDTGVARPNRRIIERFSVIVRTAMHNPLHVHASCHNATTRHHLRVNPVWPAPALPARARPTVAYVQYRSSLPCYQWLVLLSYMIHRVTFFYLDEWEIIGYLSSCGGWGGRMRNNRSTRHRACTIQPHAADVIHHKEQGKRKGQIVKHSLDGGHIARV